MTFEVKDASGNIIYAGESWPMARAALEYVLMLDEGGCPDLKIHSTEKE